MYIKSVKLEKYFLQSLNIFAECMHTSLKSNYLERISVNCKPKNIQSLAKNSKFLNIVSHKLETAHVVIPCMLLQCPQTLRKSGTVHSPHIQYLELIRTWCCKQNTWRCIKEHNIWTDIWHLKKCKHTIFSIPVHEVQTILQRKDVHTTKKNPFTLYNSTHQYSFLNPIFSPDLVKKESQTTEK